MRQAHLVAVISVLLAAALLISTRLPLAATTAWMDVTKPSTPPPSPPPGYVTPISHAERIALTYNPATDRFEADFVFDEGGRYEFVFQAEDAGGLRSQGVAVSVAVGRTFLPRLGR